MQNNKKLTKPIQLPPPGATPEVLNPKVDLSPHEIEREIFQKKIESLNYAIRKQNRFIAETQQQLQFAELWATSLQHKLRSNDDLIMVLQHVVKAKHRTYNDLFKAYTDIASDFGRILGYLNETLEPDHEWHDAIQNAIAANKITLHSN